MARAGLHVRARHGGLGRAGDQDRIDAADLAYMARVQDYLVAMLVVAVLALVFRVRWTVLSQLLAATVAGALLMTAQHLWDRSHPSPAGTASEGTASHYRENKNAFRTPGEMSPAGAQKETDRVELVLKRLWGRRDVGSEECARGAARGRVSGGTHDDACVTAFVQKTDYQVKTNGPYPEGGCFEPRAGH
ncbi:DUF6234 family protein [Streptomyces sp. ISL-44]|uniref:DUF6234 family protein n=1 Tax=Streptomyces sp. ISL-44 TaxID=2819184 RepID=UPI0027E34A4D|nr:DUF6234 family protein [Streptomyces sp. ISL-44]